MSPEVLLANSLGSKTPSVGLFTFLEVMGLANGQQNEILEVEVEMCLRTQTHFTMFSGARDPTVPPNHSNHINLLSITSPVV